MPYVKSLEFLKKYPMIWNNDNWNDYVECTNGKYKFTIPFDLDPSHLDIDYEHGKCPSELEPFISGSFFIDNIVEFTEPFEVEFSTMYDATELYFYKWDGNELSMAVIDYLSKYEGLLQSRSKITKDERNDEYAILNDMLENNSVDKRFRPSKNDWEVIYKEDVEKRSKKQKSSIKIKKDEDINAKDKEGKTALIRAVENGETETVISLIDKGCDIEAKDENQWTGGWTALMWAASKGLTETVELLINKGANIHVKDDFGCTALIAVAYAGPREIIELLIDKGADIEAKDNDGKTALIQAASNDQTENIALLLNKGADVNVKDNDGNTALSIAEEEGYTKIVKLLKKPAVSLGSKALPSKNTILTQKIAKKLKKTKKT